MAVAKGTEQIGVGIDVALVQELRSFADGRGETIRAVVEMALRRHMANPPPPPVPVIPPLVALPPVAGPGVATVAKKLGHAEPKEKPVLKFAPKTRSKKT